MASDGHQQTSQWTTQGPTPTTPPTSRKTTTATTPAVAAGTVVYAMPQSPPNVRDQGDHGSGGGGGGGGGGGSGGGAPLYASVNKHGQVNVESTSTKQSGAVGVSVGVGGALTYKTKLQSDCNVNVYSLF